MWITPIDALANRRRIACTGINKLAGDLTPLSAGISN
jgi:hypothetical protein